MPYLAYGHQPETIVPFTVTISHPATGTTLIDLTGELDTLTSPTLDQHLDRELRDRHHQALILNLSHLGFCGVAGLSCLLRARELAHEQHTSLHLVAGPRVERLLRRLHLHDRFLTCDDLTTALSAATDAIRALRWLPRHPTPAGSHPDRLARQSLADQTL